MGSPEAKQGRIGRRLRWLLALACLALPQAAPALVVPSQAPAALPACSAEARFEGLPCPERKRRPLDLGDFLAAPTPAEWRAQLALGWAGSDGSTAVRDEVGGVRIGRTSRGHEASDLPANRHDWYYELGRTYGLDWRFRRAADQAYREMCFERIAHLEGLRGLAARADVHFRYAAVRVVGIPAWLARPGS